MVTRDQLIITETLREKTTTFSYYSISLRFLKGRAIAPAVDNRQSKQKRTI